MAKSKPTVAVTVQLDSIGSGITFGLEADKAYGHIVVGTCKQKGSGPTFENPLEETLFFTLAGTIESENQRNCCDGGCESPQPTPDFKINDDFKDKRGLYLFTLRDENNCRLVYVGQAAGQTFEKRMGNYTQGGRATKFWCKGGNQKICLPSDKELCQELEKLKTFEDGGLDSILSVDNLDILRSAITKTTIGGSGTTNKRLAYFFWKYLQIDSFRGEIWVYPFSPWESILINGLKGSEHPLLNEQHQSKKSLRPKPNVGDNSLL